MERLYILRVLLTASFISALPLLALANRSFKQEFAATYQQQDEKKDKSKEKPNQEPNKPDVREVPKARKQSRPPVVAKPKIKVKPIKVVRPNIKRP